MFSKALRSEGVSEVMELFGATVHPDIYVGEPRCFGPKHNRQQFTWSDVARELCVYLPGIITVSHGSGISWVNGAGGCRAKVIPSGHWADMKPGRIAVRELLGKDVHPMRYATAGSAANLMLKYGADPQPYDIAAEIPLQGLTHGYVKVTPGTYDDCIQWDASGFYYQILQKIKSPHCLPHAKGVHWYDLNEYQGRTWRGMVSAIADAKLLRNAMVGVMTGGKMPRTAYARDKETGKAKQILIPGKYGDFRAAGMSIIRMGYEITRAECGHSGSVYSIIDCVTLPNNREPAIWPALGLKYRLRLSGQGQFLARGSYRLGGYESHLYTLGYNPDDGLEVSPGYGPVSYAAQLFTGKGSLAWLTT